MRLSDASNFQNHPHSFNSLRRDVQPTYVGANQRLPPERLDVTFANNQQFQTPYGQDFFDTGCHSEHEVRQRFNSLLNLTRDNQFLNDLGNCRENTGDDWVQNDFEMANTAPIDRMKENNSIYNGTNSYSDVIYAKHQNFQNSDISEEPDVRYGFISGLETSRIPQNDRVGGDFETNGAETDRWQAKEGLDRWSPPRDTNCRFRDADAWVSFQNA